MTRLEIGQTWDGIPLPEDERASLTLSRSGADLVVDVDAPYHGDPPPSGPPGPTDRLWEHEVVELFVVAPGDRYTEIELSPHGHHWVLRLEGIRQAVARGLPIDFEARISGDRWQGRARIPGAHLPMDPTTTNAFRIRGVGRARRYHAWTAVPGDGPNFHRLDAFGPWPL